MERCLSDISVENKKLPWYVSYFHAVVVAFLQLIFGKMTINEKIFELFLISVYTWWKEHNAIESFFDRNTVFSNYNLLSSISSFHGHLKYIETLRTVVKWSMKWTYSIQWDPIELFFSRYAFFLRLYVKHLT